MTLATDAVKRAVVAADDARLTALLQGNYEACADLLADDLVFAHASGRVEDKKTYVEGIRTGKYLIAEKSEPVVYANGNTAWMTGRIRLQLVRGGQQRDIDGRFLSVWVAEGGKWRMAAYSAMSIQGH